MEMLVRFSQPSNALAPIEVTLLVNLTSEIALFLNAAVPIEVTLAGISNCVSLEVLAKA